MSIDVVTADGRARVLADGNGIPLLGLGVWQVPNRGRVRGRRPLGARARVPAHRYGAGVRQRGERRTGVARERGPARGRLHHDEVLPRRGRTRSRRSSGACERLGVDYVDLYIIHWPEGGPTWAWPGMERAREAGYARSIGVSNFGVDDLRELLATATVPPVVDQVQFSPYEYRKALLEACRENGIALEAYSPLGTGRHLASDTVARIARRHGRTAAQVLLRWCIERGIPVIPKSTHRERIAENAQLFDFRLSDQDIAELDSLDRTGGTDRALERKWWRS